MLRRKWQVESTSVSALAVGAFAILAALSVGEIWTRHYPRGDVLAESVHEGVDYHSGLILLGISIAIAALSLLRAFGLMHQRTYFVLVAPLAVVAFFAVAWVRFRG